MNSIDKLILNEYKKVKKENYIKSIILEEHANITEDAAEIRQTLDTLDYTEKSNQLDSGGPITNYASVLFRKFFEFLKKENPDVVIRVTAGHDKFHKKYNSRHNFGEALDFTVDQGSVTDVAKTLKTFKNKHSSEFKFLDEYKNPTPHSTGPHFHIAYIGSQSQYNKSQKSGAAGKQQQAGMNVWYGESDNGVNLEKLDRLLGIISARGKGTSSGKMLKAPYKAPGQQEELPNHKWEILAVTRAPKAEESNPKMKKNEDGILIGANPERLVFYPNGNVVLGNQPGLSGKNYIKIENIPNWIASAGMSPIGNGVITLYNIAGDELGTLYNDTKYGIVFDLSNSPQYAVNDKGEVTGVAAGMNIFQTVLDVLGFIPFYGDIIDLVNAVIYYYRGKYLEAALSLIAVIPIVGSVIKFGAKGAMKAGAASIKAGGKAITNLGLKGIRKIFKKGPGGVKEAENLLGVLLDKKIIDPEDLMWVEKTGALDIILKKLTKSKKVFQKYLTKGTHKNIDEALDSFETMVKNLDTSIVKKIKVKGFGPKGYAKAASKAPPVSLLGRLANPITRLIGKPRIFQRTKNIITKLPPKKVELINGWIQKQIRQDIATDPSKLITLLKTMDPQSLKKLNFPAGYKRVPAAIKKLSSGQIDAVLKVAAEEGNVFYQAMIKNPKIYFRAQLKQGTKQKELFKVMRSGIGAKQLDVIYNEISEVFDNELGVDLGGYGDEQQSIIAATFFKIFVDKESQKRRRSNIRSFINSAAEFAGILNWISSAISLGLTERKQILNTAWNEMPGDTDGEKLQYVKTQTTDPKVIKPIVDFVKDKQQDDK